MTAGENGLEVIDSGRGGDPVGAGSGLGNGSVPDRRSGSGAVALRPQRLPSATASEAAALISMIERAAADPSMDIERVERMYAMYERAAARNAKSAYLLALSEMQPKLPVIAKRGTIERGKHKTTGEQQKGSPYARYEDVIDGIKPHLDTHGFSLSFRIAQAEGRLIVTGILGHRDGHCEETSMSLPIDDSGGKNNVQGWGSSASYGKRYTAFALLNIVARGEDDDGKAGVPAETITEDQAMDIRIAIEGHGKSIAAFCKYFGITIVEDLPAAKYADAIAAIKKRK